MSRARKPILNRREPLLAERAVAPEDVAHAQAGVDGCEIRARSGASVRPTHRTRWSTEPISRGNPAVQEARAAYREAWVNQHRNAIVAPASGYVAQRSVQIGSRVQPGQGLLTIVPLHDLWIDANFKEVQLAHIRIDQPVEVTTDLYGGDVVYHGRVEGLAAGTGGAFALLPRAERVGQLDQGRAARAGAHQARSEGSREISAARRPVDGRESRYA